eukprot:scaffold45569_cov71-Phaeocystis_antarctica.AAC.4
MPSRVVNTMGRKARPSPTQPARCFLFFSAARAMKRASAEAAVEATWEGTRGHDAVTSMAIA